MADWNDVARICLALPGTTAATSASGRRRWHVRGTTFLRERPRPTEGAKAALIAAEPEGCFTTSHFDRWTALMCRLDALDQRSLTDLAAEAWASRAPRRLMADHPQGQA